MPRFLTRRALRWVLPGVIGLFLLLGFVNARTGLPWCDEAWFADPALSLLERGVLANTVLDETSTFRTVRLDRIHEHTYWVMPLYLVAQAAWYKVIGFGLYEQRAFSLLWGLLALLLWYALVRGISRSAVFAAAAAFWIAVDFQFVWTASVGRMDMMCFALGSAGIVCYLWLRERSYTRALMAANACIAAACFTHPNGALFFAHLCLLALYLDRKQLFHKPSLALLAAAPYLIGFACWGLYIARDYEAFRLQFLGNTGNRFAVWVEPLENLKNEFVVRYMAHYGMAPESRGFSRAKLVIPAAYLLGTVVFFCLPKFRRDPRWRILGYGALLQFVFLMLYDGFKQELYLVYVVVPFAALFAVVLVHVWGEYPRLRPVAALVALALFAVQISVTGLRTVQDAYHRKTLPAVAFLNAHAAPPRIIMASSELAFFLGFTPRVCDDFRLGYRTGKRPDFIVVDRVRYVDWIDGLRREDPGNHAYIADLLSNRYKIAYDGPGYKIYQRLE